MGVNMIEGLPPEAEPNQALRVVGDAYAPGILAPTVLIVRRESVALDRERLTALHRRLEAAPGVAAVIGPEQQPLPFPVGVVLAPSNDAARLMLLLEDRPHTAAAINDLRALRDRVPSLLDEVGLQGAEYGFAGDTAVGLELIDITVRDIAVVGAAMLLVDLLLLIWFLRAVLAPLFLLAASVLVVLTALGVTGLAWSLIDPGTGFSFYIVVPIIVLLVSFGVDYNLLVVGRIWHEAESMPFSEAIVEGVTRESPPIAAAGLTLAASFGLLALVPIQPFQQLAMAIAVGVLIDTFFVRPYVVPAGLALLGSRLSRWPARVPPSP
jgi:putative drug exporter of the RND superfamily